MNGLDVIKTLKSNKQFNKRYSYSSDFRKRDRENDFKGIRIDGYLQKPVSSEQIHNTIQHIESQQDVQAKSILIVEDDKAHLNALHDYLSEEE